MMTRIVIGLLIACAAAFALRAKELSYYVDFEHMNVTYWNPRYYSQVNITARRFGRQDPIHYVQAHVHTLAAFGNNVTVDIYIYEFLSNEYRRSFLEYHHKLCDFLDKDQIFFAYAGKFFPQKTCPWPKGEYRFTNISFPDLPVLKTFPFTKGRLFVNSSLTLTGERLMEVQVDAVIKQRWR